MKATINEIKKMYSGQYADIEFYLFNSSRKSIHYDFLSSVYDDNLINDDAIAADFELMDEETYNQKMTTGNLDFAILYGIENAKVLVIVLESEV